MVVDDVEASLSSRQRRDEHGAASLVPEGVELVSGKLDPSAVFTAREVVGWDRHDDPFNR